MRASNSIQKLNVLNLAIAMGVSCAIYVVFIGIAAMFGWGTEWVKILGSLYLGYRASVLGIIIGALWAFVDGFIGGAIIAWIYNKLDR